GRYNPTLLGPDKDDMGLLDFVKSANPFKVKVRERTLVEGEVPLLIETADMVVVPYEKTVCLVSHTIADEIRDHSRKNKRKVGFSTIPPHVKKLGRGDVRMHHAYTRYVVFTSSSEHEGADTVASPKTTSPKVGSPNPHVHMRVKDVGAGAVNETVDTSLPKNGVVAASLLRIGVGTSSPRRTGIKILHTWCLHPKFPCSNLVSLRSGG
nr:transposase (putative), gypsy type [Tanacetum cinerariifolium]